jgi:hypothetical protein
MFEAIEGNSEQNYIEENPSQSHFEAEKLLRRRRYRTISGSSGRREKITFTLLKDLSHVKHWWETYWEQIPHRSLEYMGSNPLVIFLWMR